MVGISLSLIIVQLKEARYEDQFVPNQNPFSSINLFVPASLKSHNRNLCSTSIEWENIFLSSLWKMIFMKKKEKESDPLSSLSISPPLVENPSNKAQNDVLRRLKILSRIY